MTRKLDRKPEGCKLLRVEVEIEGGILLAVKVRGDFFAHPEELFEAAESALSGQELLRLREAAFRAFSREGLRLYGATAEAIADTIFLACGGEDALQTS